MSETHKDDEITTPQPSEASPTDVDSKNPKSTSNRKLSHYNRMKILENLIEEGTSPKNCGAIIRKFKVDAEVIEEYVNERARTAQHNVREECDSICFQNINNWLNYFKDKRYNTEANMETGMLMIAIAELEQHPDPNENGGIDFQKIYRFLGDVMLGNPTPELNRESREFLGREFENLIDVANSPKGDEDAGVLQRSIEYESKQIKPTTSVAKKRRREYGSLDPLSIDKLISGTAKERKEITNSNS